MTGKDPTSVDPLENDLGGPYVISAGTATYTLTYTPLNAKVYEPTGRYFTTGVMNSRTETSSFALSTGMIELSGMVPDLDSDEFRKLVRHEVCNVISSAFAAHTLSDMTFVDIIDIFRNLSAD